VFVALASVSGALLASLPPRPFHDLIDAFEQDQRITRYQSWEQLVQYCRGSANPVGRLVLAVAGVQGVDVDPGPEMPAARRQMLEQSDALCTALQLTNFWQDVRRDLESCDRVYLPRELTGFDDSTLRDLIRRSDDPTARLPFIRALRPLVDRTRSLFEQARPLPLLVPPSIATPVWLFHAAGLATLERIESTGCTTLWRRPALSKLEKGLLVLQAMLRVRQRRRGAG